MINNNYDFTLYEYLNNHLKVCYLTSDKSETNIRCPFCGDSIKDERHAHLYIHNQPPFKYFCQKCNITGIADNNFLKILELYDPNMINYLSSSKTNYIKELNKKYGNNFLSYFNKELNILPNDYNNLELKKLKYINNRLGININTEEEIEKYKIILNLQDFFNNNEININKYYKENMKFLNNNFIAFLSNDKNLISFRNLNNNCDHDKRHINKKIYTDSYIQSRKFYTINNEIDLSNEVFNIYLTEGIMDIIGVFNHLYNRQQNSNDIFVSCNGKSYPFVLNYLVSLGILNCNINIFSDKDVKKYKFENLKKYNRLCKFNGINLYYNNKGKDFGVRKDEIELSNCIVI